MGAFSTLSTYCLALLCITPQLSPWPEFHVCLLVTRVNLLNDVLFLSACRYFEESLPTLGRNVPNPNRKWGAWELRLRIPSLKVTRQLTHAWLVHISPNFRIELSPVFHAKFQSVIRWLCSALTSCYFMFRSLAFLWKPARHLEISHSIMKAHNAIPETMSKWGSSLPTNALAGGKILFYNHKSCLPTFRVFWGAHFKGHQSPSYYGLNVLFAMCQVYSRSPVTVLALPILSSMHQTWLCFLQGLDGCLVASLWCSIIEEFEMTIDWTHIWLRRKIIPTSVRNEQHSRRTQR